ncbi:hypothetical protein L4D13_22355 [Photobacterium profundum]|uniref:hypothetical protein n=1 Tax=Photobacterium profundum TaxID=74109 RepID=UPI003D0C3A51
MLESELNKLVDAVVRETGLDRDVVLQVLVSAMKQSRVFKKTTRPMGRISAKGGARSSHRDVRSSSGGYRSSHGKDQRNSSSGAGKKESPSMRKGGGESDDPGPFIKTKG